MGLFKNDVGRPSNKTIVVRNILKGIAVVVVGAGLVAGGYFFNDYKKEKSENDDKIIDKEIEPSDSKVDINDSLNTKLYSYVKGVYYFVGEQTEDFIKSPIYDADNKVLADDLSFDFKMSMVVNKSEFDFMNNKEISYEDLSKEYYEIFGEKPEKKDFFCYSLASPGEVKYSNGSYKFNGEYLTMGLEDYHPKFELVKAEIIGDEVYLYEIMYYVNVMESGALNHETVKYYNESPFNNKNAKIIFEMPSNSEAYFDEEKNKMIENSEKFTQFKWLFTKNDKGDYVFTSVEKVK